MLSGIGLFVIMTVLCATANSVESLSVFRFFRRSVAQRGQCLSRAIIRDRFRARFYGASNVTDVDVYTLGPNDCAGHWRIFAGLDWLAGHFLDIGPSGAPRGAGCFVRYS